MAFLFSPFLFKGFKKSVIKPFSIPFFVFFLWRRRRLGLRDLIETGWDLLRGQTLATDAVERDSVSHFFDLLEQNEAGGSLASMSKFADKVRLAFIPATADHSTGNSIHLLTMHKAKGLEFDHIILPGLANQGVSDRKSLLLWHERLNQSGQARLFIAALSASGSDQGLLYKLLQHEQQHKNKLEDTRLLYIAITRARKSVSLFASLPRNSKGVIAPRADSLLSRIWRELRRNPQGITEFELDQQPALAVTAQPSACMSPANRENTSRKLGLRMVPRLTAPRPERRRPCGSIPLSMKALTPSIQPSPARARVSQ